MTLKECDIEKQPTLQHSSFSGLSRESCANRHLCNNKANLLTRLVLCCNKILGTDCASRPRMTGAGDSALVPVVMFLLPLTRSDAPTSPSRGEVNRLLRFARNDGRVKCEAVSLLLCVLLLKVSFFLPNPAKTC